MIFYYGMQEINLLMNLGFMIFFTIFTAYEEIYRKTGFLLLYFISYFILVQYYFSLHYNLNVEDKHLMRSYRWFGIYNSKELSDPFGINGK